VADDPDAAVAAVLALPASAATSIPLNGGQEPADGEAGGHGSSANDRRHRILLDAVPAGNADPLAGHVHLVPRRVAGPIVIDLDTDGVGGRDASGCRVISAELAAAITSDPGAYCVNLHNAGFPAGAILGQLK
jgi:hypothetical protein